MVRLTVIGGGRYHESEEESSLSRAHRYRINRGGLGPFVVGVSHPLGDRARSSREDGLREGLGVVSDNGEKASQMGRSGPTFPERGLGYIVARVNPPRASEGLVPEASEELLGSSLGEHIPEKSQKYTFSGIWHI